MNIPSDIGTLLIVMACLFFANLLLRILNEWLTVLHSALVQVLPQLSQWAKGIGKKAGAILSEDHTSLRETIAQTGGALLMLAMGLVLAMCDLELTLSTVAPLLGITYTETGLKFEYMIAISLVVSGLVYGFVMTDLMKWTALTRFVTAQEGRASLFVLSTVLLLATISAMLALSAYRFGVMVWADTDEVVTIAGMAYTDLPFYILATLAVLYLVGAGMAFASIDTIFGVLSAFCLVVTSVVLGIIWIALAPTKVVMELLQKCVTEMLQFWSESKKVLKEAKDKFQKREPAFKSLRKMVSKNSQAPTSSATPDSSSDSSQMIEAKPKSHKATTPQKPARVWSYQPAMVMQSKSERGCHSWAWLD